MTSLVMSFSFELVFACLRGIDENLLDLALRWDGTDLLSSFVVPLEEVDGCIIVEDAIGLGEILYLLVDDIPRLFALIYFHSGGEACLSLQLLVFVTCVDELTHRTIYVLFLFL